MVWDTRQPAGRFRALEAGGGAGQPPIAAGNRSAAWYVTAARIRDLDATSGETARLSDPELLERLGLETSALETLYDRHAGYALAIALRILGDRSEAEEVVQDVFLQLWNARLRYDERRGKFTTWLFTIARNRAVDRLRRRASRPAGDPELMAELTSDETPLGRAIDGQQQRSVRAALAQLSPAQRHAIELCYFRGLTHSEIAHETGESIGTVKSRTSRALVALRDALGSTGVA